MRPAEPILHVDMDAFYAAVEVRKEPALAGKPVLVGGAGGRGVVASASYEARAFGVASAMPMARARRLCPHAIVRPPDFDAYREASAQLIDLLRSVTPLVEPLSLDEAFCDVGGCQRLFGEPPVIAKRLRDDIAGQLGLTASVGVAANKFLAKLCSQKAKPDGLLHLRVSDAPAFLAALSVRDLWGVGERTAARLGRFGIRTIGQLAVTEGAVLARVLASPAAAAELSRLARGQDARPVVPHEPAKGVSAEETFSDDLDDPQRMRRELLRLAERVGQRLRQGDVTGRTVTLKVRYANFATVTRSRTLPVPTDLAMRLHEEVCALLDGLRLERVRVRLLGVGVSNLLPAGASRQLELLEPDRWSSLEHAADAARERFGDGAVTRGALLDDST